MNKSELTDDQLIYMLKQMPSVTDQRNRQEIYKGISDKLNGKRRKWNWMMPSIASVAAIALIVLLLPNIDFIKNDEYQTANDSAILEQESKTDMNKASIKMTEDDQVTIQNSMKDQSLADFGDVERTAVYREDLNGKELLIFAIPDRNAQNITPISILVNKTVSKDWFQLFIETMPKLTEEDWGLSDYYPLEANLTYSTAEKAINLDVPVDHKYGEGSASEWIFQNSLIMDFLNQHDVNIITFTTSNKPGITLGNDKIYNIDLETIRSKAYPYFLFYVEERTQPYIVPMNKSVATIHEAISEMKKGIPHYSLEASIPTEFVIEKMVPEKDLLTIYLGKDSKIPQTEKMIYGFEALLLTAKEFGFRKVEIKNSNIKDLGPFRLDKAIEVPVSANKQLIY